VLLYVLDGSAFDVTRTPAQDLKALLNELELYSKKLVKKPSLVFINKTDVEGAFKNTIQNWCLYEASEPLLLHTLFVTHSPFCFFGLASIAISE